MKTHPLIYILIALLLAGCGTLDPTGVYQGNKGLYAADLTIATPYDTLDKFLQWELQYRPLLVSKPEIKKVADNIRMNAPMWFTNAVALRDAYAANPTDANKSAFDTALSVINKALIQAMDLMTASATLTAKKP